MNAVGFRAPFGQHANSPLQCDMQWQTQGYDLVSFFLFRWKGRDWNRWDLVSSGRWGSTNLLIWGVCSQAI